LVLVRKVLSKHKYFDFIELSGWFIYCSIIKVHCVAVFSDSFVIISRVTIFVNTFFQKFFHIFIPKEKPVLYHKHKLKHIRRKSHKIIVIINKA